MGWRPICLGAAAAYVLVALPGCGGELIHAPTLAPSDAAVPNANAEPKAPQVPLHEEPTPRVGPPWEFLGGLRLERWGYARKVQTFGERTYVAQEQSGLLVYNTRNPRRSWLVRPIQSTGERMLMVDFVVTQDYLFTLEQEELLQVGPNRQNPRFNTRPILRVRNLTDVDIPELGMWVGPWSTMNVAEMLLINGEMYIMHNGVCIIDVTDPVKPRWRRQWVPRPKFPIWGYRAFYNEEEHPGTLFLAYRKDDVTMAGPFRTAGGHDLHYSGLCVADVTKGSSTQHIELFELPGIRFTDLAVRGRRVYLSSQEQGVMAMTFGESMYAPPVLTSKHPVWSDTFRRPMQLQIVGDLLYVTDIIKGIVVVDVAQPDAPAVVGTYNVNVHMHTRASHVVGGLIYIAGRKQILRIVKVPMAFTRAASQDKLAPAATAAPSVNAALPPSFSIAVAAVLIVAALLLMWRVAVRQRDRLALKGHGAAPWLPTVQPPAPKQQAPTTASTPAPVYSHPLIHVAGAPPPHLCGSVPPGSRSQADESPSSSSFDATRPSFLRAQYRNPERSTDSSVSEI
eukprot:TRINITY_DN8903_c0_g3_i1.p1 TRINITY_DN8903_c0_g3~~TRINITY_DN8903_c0_g3_i1.p1  ORF type:complete len:566 (+),score=124.22 TRINITY_DN8903_c0_g3_i1:45-1742(+)